MTSNTNHTLPILFLFIFIACLLTACSRQVVGNQPEHTLANTQNPSQSSAASSQSSDGASAAKQTMESAVTSSQSLKQEFMKYSALIGQPDTKTVEALGTGTSSASQNQEMICREYRLHLFDETVKTHVNYDQNVVHGIVFYLKGKQIEHYEKILTKQLGDYTKKEDHSEIEEENIAITYSLGTNTLTLRYSFDTTAIEITHPIDNSN